MHQRDRIDFVPAVYCGAIQIDPNLLELGLGFDRDLADAATRVWGCRIFAFPNQCFNAVDERRNLIHRSGRATFVDVNLGGVDRSGKLNYGPRSLPVRGRGCPGGDLVASEWSVGNPIICLASQSVITRPARLAITSPMKSPIAACAKVIGA